MPENANGLARLMEDIAEILEDFRGEESLKDIFWGVLGYDRVRAPLPLPSYSRRIQQDISSIEVFAAYQDVKVLLCQVTRAPDRYGLEALGKQSIRRMPTSLFLLQGPAEEEWRLVYPDPTKRGFLRFLRLPGPVNQRWVTAQALAGLATYAPETEEDIDRLALIERLDTVYPAPTPARRWVQEDLDAYLDSISNYPLLTPAQERGEDLMSDDAYPDFQTAVDFQRWRLVTHNLRLGFQVALDHRSRMMEKLDLVQEASIGLIEAAERFDPCLGNRFSTYAWHWIRQKITRAKLENVNLIRWPGYVGYELLEANLNGKADSLRPGERFVEIRGDLLDLMCEESSGISTPLERAILVEAHCLLLEKVRSMKRKLSSVICLRFGLDGKGERTLEQIGEVLGLTRERVRQLEHLALQKLEGLLKDFPAASSEEPDTEPVLGQREEADVGNEWEYQELYEYLVNR